MTLNHKQLEADGQIRKMVENYVDRGWTAGEICEKGYVGLEYESIDRIRQNYIKGKQRMQREHEPKEEPLKEPKPTGKGGFSIEEK